MKTIVGYAVALLTALVLLSSPAGAVDYPHNTANGYTCSGCHQSHSTLGTQGYTNLCLTCHNPADGKGGNKSFVPGDAANPFGNATSARPGTLYQTSHNWSGSDNVPPAGALPPLNPQMTKDNMRGAISCVRCHNVKNPRASAFNSAPFLRTLNERDEMCLDCHRQRNSTSHLSGSHPVTVSYSGAASARPAAFYSEPVNSNPGNPTSALKLVGGEVLCSTCHRVHFADSASATYDSATSARQGSLVPSAGRLLRTDLRGASAAVPNICSNCHAGKGSHNNKGQNVQCADCHSGHVAYDAQAVTDEEKKPNVYLIRRYMNISSNAGAVRNGRVFFQYTGSSRNYVDYRGTGVCQGCHAVPLGAGYPPEHTSTDANVCATCHGHQTAIGSFSASCSSCHGYPPPAAAAGYAGVDETSSPHRRHAGGGTNYQYSCNECHKGNSHNTNTFQDVYLDRTGILAGASVTYTAATRTCANIACHGGTAAVWEKGACLGCHSIAQGNRAAVTGQFGGSSHHVQGELTDAKCYQCHWEANSNGTINAAYHGGAAASGSPVDLVIYGAATRPTTFTAGVTAVQYTADGSRGQIEKVTSHCLGCHSDQNNATDPFGDGKTPKQYAWDGTSVAARYAQTGKTTWGKYSTVTNAAQKRIAKSLSAHGNAAGNQRGWNTSTGVDGAITNTSGGTGVQCYDCHNSHGSSVAGITSRYSSATGKKRGGLLKETVTGQGGYATSYKPQAGGSAADKNVRNPGASICLDCHLNQTATSTPWGYGSTYGASQAILGYWDAPKYKEYSTSGAEQRYPFKKKNPVMGGHYGASAPLTSTPTGSIDGLCTPCHDPHGVSPTLGANQQYAVPLLKGTWLTSPYKEDTAPANNTRFTARPDLGEGLPYNIDQNTFGSNIRDGVAGIGETESQADGLCLGCHPKEALTATASPASPNPWKSKNRIHETVKDWKSSSATVKHSYSCSKCHGPHNSSVLPRLMVTNCLDGQHKGRTAWSDAKIADSGNGGYMCCSPVCSEIPYSFRREGYATFNGGAGWCTSKGYNNGTPHGSGGGRLPGSWRSDVPGVGNYSVACHEGQTGVGTDQAWNEVTPWKIYPAIAITAGPAASVSSFQATITWATTIPGSSIVDYGLTTAYGTAANGAASVLSHSVTLPGLTNHSTYHYRIKTVASDGQLITSADATVPYISVPPSIPNTTSHTSPVTCATSCPQTVSWSASTDPDGGPIEYQVQMDTTSSFTSANLQLSPWVATTSWTTNLSPNITNEQWYYRVRARDANHTLPEDLPSNWTAIPKNFMILSGPPAAPVPGVPAALSTTSIRWNFADAADNETGFKLHDAAQTVKASAATPNLSYFDETGLAVNTRYTRHLHAYNVLGDGPASVDVSRYTLPLSPSVTADKTVATWYGTANVTFTNAAGFGAGGVQYYRYAWDQNSKYTFTDTEPQWSSGTLARTATADGGWFLHVKSYNGDNVANGTKDYGPYYYDATAPTGLSMVAPLNGASNLPLQTALYAGAAADSGVGAVQYLFQIALDSDFTQGVQTGSWQSSATGNFTLLPDKTYFWRVKARDGAGNETAYAAPWSFTTTANSTVWTNKGDFEANLATTGTATTRDKVVVSGTIPTDNAAVTLDFISISAIASGNSHSVALKSDGSVWAWGANNYYQLGDGSYTHRFAPVPVPSLTSGVIAVAAGGEYSLAVKADGSLWGWGYNGSGQLGPGGYYISSPTLIQGMESGVVAAAGGKYHTLAVKSDGSVWAWGYNNYGQLGNGSTTQSVTPVQVMPAGSGVIAVAAGEYHSLALKSDGTMLAWGSNGYYQLGDGTMNQRTTPIPVSGVGSGVIAIAAGGSHSLAVKSDGSLWAWGQNYYGQVATANANVPNPVSTLGVGSGVVAVAAGYTHSLAVKANGAVYAWGSNSNGQLGNNATQYSVTTPTEIAAAGSGVTRVAAGQNHSLAIKENRYLLVWGLNDFGQLGIGDPNRSVPGQVTDLGIGSGVTMLAAGYAHSMAVKGDAAVAWGYNINGQLGDNSQTRRPTPVSVSGLASGVSRLAGGGNFSLALKQDGSVWSWGNNYDGQLGNGTNTYSLTPVSVSSLGTGITAIAAGSSHALALKPDGSLWSWGYNWAGQLGDGTSGNGTNKSTPLSVPGMDTGVVGIAAGQHHSLAVKADGSVWAWGLNNFGQLGDGTTNASSTPIKVVDAGSGVVRVAAGNSNSFAIKADGSVLAWGYDYYGQLGDAGSYVNRMTPVAATAFGSGIISLAAGQDHTVVVKSDGSVWGVGRNSYGQLGDGTFVTKTTPVPVSSLGSGVVGVAANSNFSLALKSDGTVLAWGDNSASQLGNGYTSPVVTPTQNLFRGLYKPQGSITGLKYDAGSAMNWGTVSWNASLPANTVVTFRARGADNEANLAGASWSGYYTTTGSAINIPASRWLELEMNLATGDGFFTPTLDDCTITYATHYTDSQAPVGLGNASPADGARNVPVGSTLDAIPAVDSDSGSVQYYFQIAKDSGFTTAVQTSGWQAATSYSPTLALSNTYFWRVKARDAAQNETSYTPTWSFGTTYPPTAPTAGTPQALSTTSIRWNFADTSDSEDGFRLHDGAQALKASAATPNLAWLDESGLTANTLYTRHLHAYNNVAGDSAASADMSTYTMAVPPNVTTSAMTPATWTTTANTSCTNSAGFGSGGVQYYRYVWNQNATYIFNETEPTWSSSFLPSTSLANGSWYLHVKAYNGGDVSSGTQDLGPYYIDSTPPTGLDIQTPANGVTGLPTNTTLNVKAAVDNESGGVQYYFQIATNSSFTDGLQTSYWTASTTYSPPLSAGTTYYWRVITRDYLSNTTSLSAAPVWSFTTTGVKTTWTSKGDFENNAVTAAGSVPVMVTPATSRKLVMVSGASQSDDASLSNLLGVSNTTLAGGGQHSLALKADGSVWGWGYNYYGEVGDNTTIDRNAPVAATSLVAGTGVVGIAAGSYHSLAVLSNGSVWAWGQNSNYQLGDGFTTTRTSPVMVSGLGILSGTVKVAAGSLHSLALKSNGSVWAWGYNGHGQLGTNDMGTRTTPVAISTLASGVAGIVAGELHSVAFKTDGSAWAWGFNSNGQVGDNSTTNRLAPVQVNGLGAGAGVIAVAAGSYHTLALKDDGSVWAWGSNANGQLGDNSTTQRLVPVQVYGLGPGAGVIAVAAGGNFSLALKSDGSVWAWGQNTLGQLGDNSNTQRITPVQVTNLGSNSGVIKVAAGSLHSLALKNDGSIWAWGYNSNGRLGDNSTTDRIVPVQSLITDVKTPLVYYSPGTVTNLKLNAGAVVNWSAISWNGTTPTNTTVKLRTRGANTEVGLGSAGWSAIYYPYTPMTTTITTPASQWLEVELTMQSTDNAVTPMVNDVSVSYVP